MRRFKQAMVVVIMGVAVSTLFAQALASASREPAAAQEKHWAYEDSAKTVGPAKSGHTRRRCDVLDGQTASAHQPARRHGDIRRTFPNLVFAC